MNKLPCLKTSIAIAALLMLPIAHAETMNKADYTAGKSRISADYTRDHLACNAMAGNKKEICAQEAIGKRNIATAELEYGYTGKPGDEARARVVRAESAYDVAKQKCDDKAGNDKDVCIKEAKAVETKALADVKMGKEIGAAQNDAAEEKRGADYSVAREKCDAMAGDAKSACIDAAKARYGKS